MVLMHPLRNLGLQIEPTLHCKLLLADKRKLVKQNGQISKNVHRNLKMGKSLTDSEQTSYDEQDENLIFEEITS